MKNKYQINDTDGNISVRINGNFSMDEIECIYDEMLRTLGKIAYCPICGIEFGYGHRTDCNYKRTYK